MSCAGVVHELYMSCADELGGGEERRGAGGMHTTEGSAASRARPTFKGHIYIIYI